MPTILSINDLTNTAKISALCEATDGPISIAKNACGTMSLMSMRHHEEAFARAELHCDLDAAEADVAEGRVAGAETVLPDLRQRFGL